MRRGRWRSVGAWKAMLVIESLETWRTADKVGLSIGSESWLYHEQIDARIVAGWVVHQKREAQSWSLEPADSLEPHNYDGNERSIARPGKSFLGGSRLGVTLLRTLEQSIYRNVIGWWHLSLAARVRREKAFFNISSYIRNMSLNYWKKLSLGIKIVESRKVLIMTSLPGHHLDSTPFQTRSRQHDSTDWH